VVKCTFDGYCLPYCCVGLFKGDGAELDDSVALDVGEAFVLVKVLGGEILPFAVVDLEAPFVCCVTAVFCSV